MNEIIITISGPVNCGKSRITYLIKKMLKENNFLVNFENDIDYSNENYFDRIMTSNINESLSNIKKRSIVTIKQTQLKRPTVEDEKRIILILRKIKLNKIKNANRTN